MTFPGGGSGKAREGLGSTRGAGHRLHSPDQDEVRVAGLDGPRALHVWRRATSHTTVDSRRRHRDGEPASRTAMRPKFLLSHLPGWRIPRDVVDRRGVVRPGALRSSEVTAAAARSSGRASASAPPTAERRAGVGVQESLAGHALTRSSSTDGRARCPAGQRGGVEVDVLVKRTQRVEEENVSVESTVMVPSASMRFGLNCRSTSGRVRSGEARNASTERR